MTVEQSSLNDALQAADKETIETTELVAEKATEPEWELPTWATKWDEPSKQALKHLRGIEGSREHFERVIGCIEDANKFSGRQGQEYGEYRKRMAPIEEVIGPYVQQFQMNGMTPQQGIQRLFAIADSLSQNPDQTFPYLAGMYKPRDAGQALKALAQAWGADLGQVTAEAPYVDPALQQMLGGYQSELQQMKQFMWSQQQAQQQGQQQTVLNEIQAFESAADEKGSPKHPHYREVYDDMVALIQMGRARSLPDAYEMAVRFNPKLSATVAEQRALEAAARQTAEANKAAEASRNVSGKPKGRDRKPSSIEEAMRAADKEAA